MRELTVKEVEAISGGIQIPDEEDTIVITGTRRSTEWASINASEWLDLGQSLGEFMGQGNATLAGVIVAGEAGDDIWEGLRALTETPAETRERVGADNGHGYDAADLERELGDGLHLMNDGSYFLDTDGNGKPDLHFIMTPNGPVADMDANGSFETPTSIEIPLG